MTTRPLAPSAARVLVPAGIAIILSLTGDQTLYATLATQADVVGITLTAVGIMLGVNRLIRIPGNPIGGIVVDRFGRRWPFIMGMLLGAISTASYSLGHGFWIMLAGRVLWGLSWILIWISMLSIILDITVPANRGRITGIVQMCYLLGQAASALAGGFLVDALGFRPALLVCALATGVGMLAVLVGLPETAPRRSERPRWSLQAAIPAGRAVLSGTGAGILVVACMYMVTNFAGNGVVMSSVSLLLKERFGDHLALGGLTVGIASLSGVLLGVRAFLGMLAGPLAGRLSDSPRGRWGMIASGFVVGIAGFLLLALDLALPAIAGGIALVAIAGGMLLPTLAAQAGDLTRPENQGRVMGLYATGGDVGSAAGPFVAYALAPSIGLGAAYLICAGLFIAALVAIPLLGRPATQQREPGVG
jgi:MFS family permease